MISVRAPAKLNLVLEILGKRSDGYHNISSIMQTVDLCDELSFEHADELALKCTARELEKDYNLALKAAQVLKQKCGYRKGATISLKKNIPWDAGLGGGSSDAAVTLLALNRLWSAGCSKDELKKLGAEIGSDVPFFIESGTCLAEGRGERLTALPGMHQAWFVLVVPDVKLPPGKTAAMYKMVGPALITGGEYTSAALNALAKEYRLRGQYLYNAFDILALKAYPGIDVCLDSFKRAGAEHVHMAGSGPVLFTMLEEKSRAETLAAKMKSMQFKTFTVASMDRSEIGN
jgi:4-diphosphocytidyl-2-C-methyl-D-erythritol kinase